MATQQVCNATDRRSTTQPSTLHRVQVLPTDDLEPLRFRKLYVHVVN